jgi:hypothetical protein
MYSGWLVLSRQSNEGIFEGLKIHRGGENQEFLQNFGWEPLSK